MDNRTGAIADHFPMSFLSSCLVRLSSFLCTRSALPLLDAHLWLRQMSNEVSSVTDTIELGDLPSPNTQGYSSSRNVPNDNDEPQDLQHINSQHDELERKLQPKCRDNTDIQAFLRDYAQFKRSPGLKVFKYMVVFEVFQPPSTFEYPLFPLASSGQRQGHSSFDRKTSFSHFVGSLRAALNVGATECARFW